MTILRVSSVPASTTYTHNALFYYLCRYVDLHFFFPSRVRSCVWLSLHVLLQRSVPVLQHSFASVDLSTYISLSLPGSWLLYVYHQVRYVAATSPPSQIGQQHEPIYMPSLLRWCTNALWVNGIGICGVPFFLYFPRPVDPISLMSLSCLRVEIGRYLHNIILFGFSK